MKYKYPDGNEVVFVMFLFNAKADLAGKIAEDNKTLIYTDKEQESLQLEFKSIEEISVIRYIQVKKDI